MKTEDIIRKDAPEENPDDVIRSIAYYLSNDKGVLLRQNDTVIFAYKFADDLAGMHLFTIDSPIKVVRAVKYFIKEATKHNIKTVYGLTENKQMYRVFKLLGLNVDKSDLPQYNWKWQVKE
jgi:hypothetical protein